MDHKEGGPPDPDVKSGPSSHLPCFPKFHYLELGFRSSDHVCWQNPPFRGWGGYIVSPNPCKPESPAPDLLSEKPWWYRPIHLPVMCQCQSHFLPGHLLHRQLLLLPNVAGNIRQIHQTWFWRANDKPVPLPGDCWPSCSIRYCDTFRLLRCAKIPWHSPPYPLAYHHSGSWCGHSASHD